MRATGIVRRIDELGRVVIPKEIRRTLRIREGDPLEIYTDRDGEVILKKYSPDWRNVILCQGLHGEPVPFAGAYCRDCGPRSGGGGERSAAQGAGRQADLPRAGDGHCQPTDRCPESAERREGWWQ